MFAKKLSLFIPTLLLASPMLFSCTQLDPNTLYLRVLNSEDYIAEGLIEKFEEKATQETGKKVKVIYETFDTMENMFNTLKTGKTKYDLVCASDYMVQKLVNADLLEEIEHDKSGLENYDLNANYIRGRLEDIEWGPESNRHNLDKYSVCYMWGTLGILYNPSFPGFTNSVNTDMESWNALWDSKYNRTIAIKDSMRDTYAIGLIHSYQDELAKAESDVEARQKIFDYGGEEDEKAQEHINVIKKDLLSLRNNAFGFEVDSGKEDIVTGKIGIDTAWSGDAVRAINTAEEERGIELRYSVPKEGSNLWFDCWTVLKGANKDLSYKFLNFISNSENAIANMDEIGYTSSIGNEATYNYFKGLYGDEANDDNETYNLNYFFGPGHELNVKPEYVHRQLAAQFPEGSETNKLMVMKDYGKNNDLILKMWEEVKHESLPVWAITLFVIEIAAIAVAVTVVITIKLKNKRRRENRKAKSIKTN